MEKLSTITTSSDETIAFAERFALTLKPGSVLCLEGDLGSGKTTFIKGVAAGLGLPRSEQVKNPTFVLMHVYRTKIPLYHFDCYRIDSVDELANIGVGDFAADPGAICCIEWAEKAGDLIPPHAYHVRLAILGECERKIDIVCPKAVADVKRSGKGRRMT